MAKKIELEIVEIKTIADLLEERKWMIDKNKMMSESNRIHATLYLQQIIDKLEK